MANNDITYNGKSLPEVFKELQESKRKSQEEYIRLKEQEKIEEQERLRIEEETKKYTSRNYKSRNGKSIKNFVPFSSKSFVILKTKINNFFVVLVGTGVVLTVLLTNSIFATQIEIKSVSGFNIENVEANKNPIDLEKVLNENIEAVTRKEIVTLKDTISFMTTYQENPNLPKNEKIVVVEGKNGLQENTISRVYENEKLVEENVIEAKVLEDTITEVVEVGTSEFLDKLKVHINERVFVDSDTELYQESYAPSKVITIIPEFYDVKLVELTNEYFSKVEYLNKTGYVENKKLTSLRLDPNIIEKNRDKKIRENLNFNMELNKPSGLTLDDYKKIFTGNKADKNKIFENNYKVFYDMEQKYNINGIFLASIAIHESGWGNSKIAKDKNNLFGFGSYDSSPYQSSANFNTYESGIEIVAKSLAKNYLNPKGIEMANGEYTTGIYYNGPTVSGVNVRYASDPQWKNKVFSKMQQLYNRL